MKNIVVIFWFFIPLITKAQIISTYVGNGLAGCSGFNGSATSAKVNDPNGMCIDVNGNIYFADEGCGKVGMVDTFGLLTNVAGGGSGGDGIPATNSAINLPNAIACDNFGNLYISDGGLKIRRVKLSTGIITAYAGNGLYGFGGDGGPATNASLGASGICCDRYGNLYISDGMNNRIRKIDTFGVISTIAGTGIIGFYGDGGPATLAQMWDPYDIKIDNFGNLYFPDEYNHRIRKIDTNGIITTIAGTGFGLYNGDGIVATNANIASYKIGIDRFGNIFASDSNSRIRLIDKSGIIHTIAGTGINGYNGDNISADSSKVYIPTGIVIDYCGNIYFGEDGNSRIRKITFPHCNYLSVANIKYEQSELSIYPNPTSEEITISGIKTNTKYSLFNIKSIKEQQGILKAGSNMLSIEALSPGLYILELTMDDGTRIMKKIIKL